MRAYGIIAFVVLIGGLGIFVLSQVDFDYIIENNSSSEPISSQSVQKTLMKIENVRDNLPWNPTEQQVNDALVEIVTDPTVLKICAELYDYQKQIGKIPSVDLNTITQKELKDTMRPYLENAQIFQGLFCDFTRDQWLN